MRKLHLQFYLAILATLAVFAIAMATFWGLTGASRGEAWGVGAAAQLAESLLPPASASAAEQRQALDDLHRRLRMDLALYDREGKLLVASANVPHLPPARLREAGWKLAHGGPVWVLPLGDDRRLVVRHPHPPRGIGWHAFVVPVSITLAFALGAYPIARRLTGRLARLRSGVERLGEGDLTARVPIEGRDEVAALARSFNESAERMAELVRSQKLLLANCSHELRTPLARIRLGIERLAEGRSSPAAHEELRRSIAELDSLIEEMLLASRLDTLHRPERLDDVDLLALAAEEAAHFERAVEGAPTVVRGDPELLRRMIRNLLDNAQRHGGGATRVEVGTGERGLAQLLVEDNGPGIAEADRDRIFEPFYRGTGSDAAARGFGLGLSLVRQIARAHGGEVNYAPLPAGGSRFTVLLRPSGPT